MGALRRNAVALLALGVVVSGGSAWAGAKIGSNQIAPNAVKSRHLAPGAVKTRDLAPNAATGRKVAEATLGPVPRAKSVGGVSVRTVRTALSASAPPARVVRVANSEIQVGCNGGFVTFGYTREISGPPFTLAVLSANDPPFVTKPAPTQGGVRVTGSAGTLTASIRESTGRVTRVALDGFAEANAYGGTDDCFYQGTIKTFG